MPPPLCLHPRASLNIVGLTYDEVPGWGEHQGAGEYDSIQADTGRSDPQTGVVEQPNEATAQAEVDRTAVGYDAIVALNTQGYVM